MTTKDIIREFELTLDQADEAGNQAAESISEFLQGANYEILEDGVSVMDSEDTIIEVSQGNYDNVAEFEEEANKRYISAFQQAAALISSNNS